MREWMPLKITEYSICVFVYCLLQLLWKLHASAYGNTIALVNFNTIHRFTTWGLTIFGEWSVKVIFCILVDYHTYKFTTYNLKILI